MNYITCIYVVNVNVHHITVEWNYNGCIFRLEEESNAAQKLAIERATAENKIKGLEEQMTIQEDSISKVRLCECTL